MTCATHLALERAQLKKLLFEIYQGMTIEPDFETCSTTRTHHLQQHLQKRAIAPTGYLNTRHEQTHNLERSIIGLKDLRTQTENKQQEIKYIQSTQTLISNSSSSQCRLKRWSSNASPSLKHALVKAIILARRSTEKSFDLINRPIMTAHKQC